MLSVQIGAQQKSLVLLSFSLKQQKQYGCCDHGYDSERGDHAAETAAVMGSSSKAEHRRMPMRGMMVVTAVKPTGTSAEPAGASMKSSVSTAVEPSVKSSRTWHKMHLPFLAVYHKKQQNKGSFRRIHIDFLCRSHCI